MLRKNNNKCGLSQYLSNIWASLMGENPLHEEMERLREAHEENAAQLLALKNLYCDCVDIIDKNARQMTEDIKIIGTLQALVENLRERIREKDALIESFLKNNR